MYLADKAAKAVQEAPLPTTMRGWALEYAKLGYFVFPLHNINQTISVPARTGRIVMKPSEAY